MIIQYPLMVFEFEYFALRHLCVSEKRVNLIGWNWCELKKCWWQLSDGKIILLCDWSFILENHPVWILNREKIKRSESVQGQMGPSLTGGSVSSVDSNVRTVRAVILSHFDHFVVILVFVSYTNFRNFTLTIDFKIFTFFNF